jgi:hypothetical protein
MKSLHQTLLALALWPLVAAILPLATTGSALATVHYVDVNSTNATPPYTNWATAATNIQDPVDAAVAGDEVVVTNGSYYPVYVNKALNVRSVNGAQFTTINGGGSGRCVYMTINSASLSGFTLTNGFTYGSYDADGGGAYGGTLNNCTLTGNSAIVGGPVPLTYTAYAAGGGAYSCTLNNCRLTGNSASASYFYSPFVATYEQGGGAAGCTLNNCTLTGNSVASSVDSSGLAGAGAYDCTLNNCISFGNYRQSNCEDCYSPGMLVGKNWTGDPLFANLAAGNLRLQPNSPCINAGNNSSVTNATDLDGKPRISGGTVDIGAYEYQWPQLTIDPSGPNVVLSWPTNNAGYDYTGFTLQTATNLASPVWITNSPPPVVIGGQNVIINPLAGPQQFYRLKQRITKSNSMKSTLRIQHCDRMPVPAGFETKLH